MLLALLSALLFSGSVWADDSYRWKDAEGDFIYSPTPPTDPDQPYVLLRDGVVIESFEGSERFTRPDNEEEELRRKEEAQRRSDALLMVQFKSLDDIDNAMEAELDNLRYDFNLLDGSYDSLQSSLFDQISLAADRERAALPVSRRQVEQIESLRGRLVSNREDREELIVRETEIREEYDRTRERYRRILEQSSPP